LGAGIEFKVAYPLCRYVQIEPNTRLPFGDNSFDIATSNAVLEHVGSYENQMLFVKELCRVANRVFVTVPNRFFPIEHHTALPFAHYQNGTFRIACEIARKSKWSREENLILMTRKRLWQLASPITKSAAVGYTGLLLGPFSSNLYLAFR
jgi:ubiquinone/menaquinone biosynthesis C-methylase UbiE